MRVKCLMISMGSTGTGPTYLLRPNSFLFFFSLDIELYVFFVYFGY